MSDDPKNTAFNSAAPKSEQYDAQVELTKSHTSLGDILPSEDVQAVIDQMVFDYEVQDDMRKSGAKIIPFPTREKKPEHGMQSVYLDNMHISSVSGYMEKPSSLGFQSLRSIVEQTPVLNAVIMTRIRQVSRFTRQVESDGATGFEIQHIERNHDLSTDEQESIKQLSSFFSNSGWETNPRRRQRLKRRSFAQFVNCFVRDSLIMDSAPIETEMKRDKSLGIDGFYNVDGSTIRLCSENGYDGDDEIFAVQVVNGVIRTAYTYEDLIYVPRNPRADVLVSGYGMSEVELMIRVVTGFLNAMTYNIKGFDENAIPKGILHLSGDYDNNELTAFKRYWNAMVRGVNNSWSLPVMVSKDQESKASFESFGVDYNEMYFSKWMTFLTSIICAIYGMSPDEVNFESFSASKSSLSGSDTSEKLADSKDKGLRPLLTYMEDVFTGYILNEFTDKYVFRWTGLERDEDRRFEITKSVATVNESRSTVGMEPIKSTWGDAPINPSLIGVWQQEQQANQPEDYGAPEDENQGQDQEPGKDVESSDFSGGGGDFSSVGGNADVSDEGELSKSQQFIYKV